MTFLRIFRPASLLRVSCSRGVGVIKELVKCSTISRSKLDINSRANIFGASDESDMLQDNRIKNYHPLGIPFPSLYTIELCRKGWYDIFPDTARRYVIALGWQIEFLTYLATYHPRWFRHLGEC